MNSGIRNIVFCTMLVLMCSEAYADKPSAGFFNSPKGLGISVSHYTEAEVFNTYTLYCDIYALPSGRTVNPGVKFCFGHNRIISSSGHAGTNMEIYYGPGASLGYVHDWEKGFWNGNGGLLRKGMGVTAALDGTFGMRFSFDKNIYLDLSWTAQVGLHARRDEKGRNNILMSFYFNGIMQLLYPQLLIMYRF